jgi:hypothetical protein
MFLNIFKSISSFYVLFNHHICDSSAKQGDNYSTRSIKLKGAVTSSSMISNSKHFAVGTEKGIVRNLLLCNCFFDFWNY